MRSRPRACAAAELVLRTSVAGLSLFPFGYDRKERLQEPTYHKSGCGFLGPTSEEKKNFQTKGCIHVFSACSFKLGGCRAQCRIAAVLFLFPKDQIEMASGERGYPMWHVETADRACGASCWCRL